MCASFSIANLSMIHNFSRYPFSDTVTREDNHPAMGMINETLTLLVSKNIHGNTKTLELFQCCWTCYQDIIIPPENRNKIFEAFLHPMLSNSSSLLVRLFFQETIEFRVQGFVILRDVGAIKVVEDINTKISLVINLF